MRTFLLILGCMVVYMVSCTPSEKQSPTEADVQVINDLLEKEGDAFIGGNIKSMLALFTEDCVVMPPNEPKVNGHEELRLWFERLHENFSLSGGYTESHIDIAGDRAIQRYAANLSITSKNGGKTVEQSIKGIHIFQRQDDGSWLIEQDIWNVNPPNE